LISLSQGGPALPEWQLEDIFDRPVLCGNVIQAEVLQCQVGKSTSYQKSVRIAKAPTLREALAMAKRKLKIND